MITGYKFFSVYQSIKLHFTSSYDHFKYAGKSKSISREKFGLRNDYQKFVFWANKLNDENEAIRFCVFNFIKSDSWFYDSFESAKSIQVEKEGFYGAFKHNISKSVTLIKKIKEENVDINIFEETKSGNKPPLLQLYLQHAVSMEFICILNHANNFVDSWLYKYSNDPFITQELDKIKKYSPFVLLFSKN